ncbi:sensor histidine kinase [Hydrogenophaga sp. MI9]|uniref:sensor histidine kinase n=1 Tax=Hydrogenophaga sp. MI9 TaxID=3453719 RepID=UPI003EEDEDBE
MSSIRSRLLLWQISALLITALVVSLLTYRLALDGFNDVQDYGLEQIAHTVLRHDETPVPAPASRQPPAPVPSYATGAETTPASPTDEEPTIEEPADDEPDEGQFVSQIWSTKGKLIYSSALDEGPPLQPPGLHTVVWQDHTWRVFTLPRETRTAQVAVSRAERNQGFSTLVMWLLLPMAVLVVLLGVLIHEAVSRALHPLDRLRSEIGQRDVSQLHAVPLEDLPDELAPLANTLNQLLARLDHLLAGQRQFLADAAHELNTPLAAIKLQAQLARRAQDAERQAALDDLDSGIERAIHLAAQLLQLARLEPDQREPHREPVALDKLVRQAVVAFSAQADQRDVDLGLIHTEPLEMSGDRQALRAMLDNLIDNALRYAPAGSRVDVSLHRDGPEAAIEVCDNGPGIACEDREKVLQRFVRLNQTDVTGSGLGLAIVRETVGLHAGSLQLDETPGGGLTVRIRLPLDTPSTISKP